MSTANLARGGKMPLLPTPAHNGIAKKTAVGATIQKASSN
jgi:hypothetical protein